MRDKADRGSSSNRVALDISGLAQFVFLTVDLRYPDIKKHWKTFVAQIQVILILKS